MISPYIQEKINQLQETILTNQRVFLKLRWQTQGTMHVFARRDCILESVLRLQTNYSKYYGTPYIVKSVNVLKTINKQRLHIF